MQLDTLLLLLYQRRERFRRGHAFRFRNALAIMKEGRLGKWSGSRAVPTCATLQKNCWTLHKGTTAPPHRITYVRVVSRTSSRGWVLLSSTLTPRGCRKFGSTVRFVPLALFARGSHRPGEVGGIFWFCLARESAKPRWDRMKIPRRGDFSTHLYF